LLRHRVVLRVSYVALIEATAYGGCSYCNGPRLVAGVSASTVSDDPTPSQV